MNNLNPHYYLGLPISGLDKPLFLNFEDHSGKSYRLLDGHTNSLFGLIVTDIFIKTNNDDIIVSISTNFPQILGEKAYEDIIDTYGEPHSVLKEDTVTEEKEFLTDNFGTIKSGRFSLSDVTVHKKPILLVWQYNDVQIVVNNNSKNNSLKILFTDISMSGKG